MSSIKTCKLQHCGVHLVVDIVRSLTFELLLHSFPLCRDLNCKYFSLSGCSSLHLGEQTVEREGRGEASMCAHE